MAGVTEGSGFRVVLDGTLICTQVWGQFEPELFARFVQDVEPLQQQLAGAPWAMLIEISGQVEVDYDLALSILDSVRVGQRIGRKATAIVLDRSIPHADLVQGILAKVYFRAKEPCAFFPTVLEAKNWLHEQLLPSAPLG